MIVYCKQNTNIKLVHEWDQIIKYVEENNICLVILDYWSLFDFDFEPIKDDTVFKDINDRIKAENKLTEDGLAHKLHKLQQSGVVILCLVDYIECRCFIRNLKYILNTFNIYPNETYNMSSSLDNKTNKTKEEFVKNILEKHSGIKAIFISSDKTEASAVSCLNPNIIVFYYFKDKLK